MKTLTFISAFLFILITDTQSQEQLSSEELQADFREFRSILEDNHCCLYEYSSKEELDSLFALQYNKIDTALGLSDFYKLLTPVTAKIGCGHTAVWMPGSYWRKDTASLFPVKIKLIKVEKTNTHPAEEYMVATGSYTDSLEIPIGSVILEINGRRINEIIAEIRANYSADAFNIHFINAQIERRFPLIFARRFGYPNEYVVNYALPKRKTSKTKSLTPASDQEVRDVIFSNFNHPPLEFELITQEKAAVLTIPTFIYYDKVQYFTTFIDSCFAVIKENKIENLILDLRGNDGGDPFCAAPLFSYLQPRPLPYFAEPYGKYSDLAIPLPLPENHFIGNLITLLDGRCFSTNAHLCSLLKYHKIGTIVGTSSGGTYICNAGKNTHMRLTNSGIQVYLGRSSFSAAVEGMDKSNPIEPDYYVTETYFDFFEEKDEYMEKAFEIIDRERKIGLF